MDQYTWHIGWTTHWSGVFSPLFAPHLLPFFTLHVWLSKVKRWLQSCSKWLIRLWRRVSQVEKATWCRGTKQVHEGRKEELVRGRRRWTMNQTCVLWHNRRKFGCMKAIKMKDVHVDYTFTDLSAWVYIQFRNAIVKLRVKGEYSALFHQEKNVMRQLLG